MQANRPPSGKAEAVERGPKKSPGYPAVPASRGSTGAPRRKTNPFAVPRAVGGKTVRVYTRGTSLPVSTVENALRDQLGVEIGRVQVCGSSHIDMVLKNAEDKKKTEHGSIQVEGKVFHVGPTFSHEENVAAVILSGVDDDDSAEKATEALRAALGEGARFLAATHGSSLQMEKPDFSERVYLEVDPEVRMRDVVPRMLQVDGRKVYVIWYNAGPFCRRCGNHDHVISRCGAASRRPRGRAPARPTKENDESLQTPPASAETTDSESAPTNNQTNSADEHTPAHTANEPATEARPAVAESVPYQPLGNETCGGALDAGKEAPAEPANTQAEPESPTSGPVPQGPAAVTPSAAAETAQRKQPGNKTRDGAVDVSKQASTSRVTATSIASRTAPPAAVRRSARIRASSVAAPERRLQRPLTTTQQASLRSPSRKDTSDRLSSRPLRPMRSIAVRRVSENHPT
jgi:hypothetical protein